MTDFHYILSKGNIPTMRHQQKRQDPVSSFNLFLELLREGVPLEYLGDILFLEIDQVGKILMLEWKFGLFHRFAWWRNDMILNQKLNLSSQGQWSASIPLPSSTCEVFAHLLGYVFKKGGSLPQGWPLP